MRAKWFCCAFKLSFVQLICKASLILKWNLEVALSIILKERSLYESKHGGVEMLKNFTVFMTFRYYFISLQHPWYHTFTFHLLFSLYLTLIISIFHCLDYTSLLLHLIITYYVSIFYNNYVINICPRQLLWFIWISLVLY